MEELERLVSFIEDSDSFAIDSQERVNLAIGKDERVVLLDVPDFLVPVAVERTAVRRLYIDSTVQPNILYVEFKDLWDKVRQIRVGYLESLDTQKAEEWLRKVNELYP